MTFLSMRDLGLVLLVVLLWGAHPAVIKIGLQEVDPLVLGSVRYFLTALVFAPFIRRLDWSLLPYTFLAGVFFLGLNMAGSQMALDHINSNSFILIVMVSIPLAIILDWVLFRKAFGLYTCVGILIAFAGMVVLYGAPDVTQAPIGFFYACLAITGWVVGSFIMRKLGDVDFGFFSVVTGVTAGILIGAWSYMVEEAQLRQFMTANWLKLGPVIVYQVLVLGVMTFIWRGLMARNAAELVTPFLLLQVPWGALIGFFALGEGIALQTWIGGFCIVSGVGLIQLRKLWQYKEQYKQEA